MAENLADKVIEENRGEKPPKVPNQASGLDGLLESLHRGENLLSPYAAKYKAKLEDLKLKRQQFWASSQKVAVDYGNQNSCDSKYATETQATNIQKSKARTLPHIPYTAKNRALYRNKPAEFYKGVTLPDKRMMLPVVYQSRRTSRQLNTSQYNQLRNQRSKAPKITIPILATDLESGNNDQRFNRWTRGQMGDATVSIGEKALIHSADGTPYYGANSYMERSRGINEASNLITSASPPTEIPKSIQVKSNKPKRKVLQPIGASASQQQNILLMLGSILVMVAVIALLVPYGLIASAIGMMVSLGNLITNTQSIAAIVGTVFDNIWALMGAPKDSNASVSKMLDEMMGSIFGRGNYEYAKLQIAKLSNSFVAGANIVGSLRSSTNTIIGGVELTANNAAKTHNALKAAGAIEERLQWMDEQVNLKSQAGTLGQVNEKLTTSGAVISDLQSITSELKTSKEAQEQLDKDYDARITELETKAQEYQDLMSPEPVVINPPTKADI